MVDGERFLSRCLESVKSQSYTDYEIVITKEGKMAENTNAAVKRAKGDIIKILFMDDYFAHTEALQHIHDQFKGGWLATGCVHDDNGIYFNPHLAHWDDDVMKGVNTIGSPSVVAFENDDPLLFDVGMSWVLDCDLYARLHSRYGNPTIIDSIDVVIGVGNHQTTNLLSEKEKLLEQEILIKRYE